MSTVTLPAGPVADYRSLPALAGPDPFEIREFAR